MKKFDLLFFAPDLRKDIQKEMDEMGITTKSLCDEAKDMKLKGLNPSSVSRFFADSEGKREGSITQGVLIYMLFRLGFDISMTITPGLSKEKEQLKQKARIFATENILHEF